MGPSVPSQYSMYDIKTLTSKFKGYRLVLWAPGAEPCQKDETPQKHGPPQAPDARWGGPFPHQEALVKPRRVDPLAE